MKQSTKTFQHVNDLWDFAQENKFQGPCADGLTDPVAAVMQTSLFSDWPAFLPDSAKKIRIPLQVYPDLCRGCHPVTHHFQVRTRCSQLLF